MSYYTFIMTRCSMCFHVNSKWLQTTSPPPAVSHCGRFTPTSNGVSGKQSGAIRLLLGRSPVRLRLSVEVAGRVAAQVLNYRRSAALVDCRTRRCLMLRGWRKPRASCS